jgi:hypothetical protein
MSYLQSLMSTGETVVLKARAHWITLVRSLLVNGVVIFLLAALSSYALQSAGADGSGWRLAGWILLLAILVPAALLVRDLAEWWTHRTCTSSPLVASCSSRGSSRGVSATRISIRSTTS